MAGKKDIYKYGKGTQFSSDNQPQNRGRKPKLYTIAKKTYGISFDEFKEVVNYLVQCPKKTLEKIADNEDTPIWMVNVCRAIHKDTGRGVINTLRELVAFMWSKDMASKIDVTTNGRDISSVPPSVSINVVTNDECLLNLQEKSVFLTQDEEE